MKYLKLIANKCGLGLGDHAEVREEFANWLLGGMEGEKYAYTVGGTGWPDKWEFEYDLKQHGGDELATVKARKALLRAIYLTDTFGMDGRIKEMTEDELFSNDPTAVNITYAMTDDESKAWAAENENSKLRWELEQTAIGRWEKMHGAAIRRGLHFVESL
jgi:hypothetical protein